MGSQSVDPVDPSGGRSEGFEVVSGSENRWSPSHDSSFGGPESRGNPGNRHRRRLTLYFVSVSHPLRVPHPYSVSLVPYLPSGPFGVDLRAEPGW